LVDTKDIDKLSSELENRLDDLFGENDIHLPDAPENEAKEHYPLAELKNLILSIDWEITDEVLDNLLQQLKDLQLTYKHDKIVSTFLQILNSLTNYIKTHRAKAHPKTFKILNSVFASLDKVVLGRDMAEPAKKKILRTEMNRYKELRSQIAKSKAADRRAAQAHPPRVEPSNEMAAEKEPVLDLRETAAAVSSDSSEEAAIRLDQPSGETAINLPEESAPESSQPSNVVELKTRPEPSVELKEPAVPADTEDEESVLTLVQNDEPAADAASDDTLDAGRGIQAQGELASLTEAVEEIKRYIHTEISALKEEIQALRGLK
jgi:hypothetical protein